MPRQLRLLDNESGLVEITSRVQHGRFLLRPSAEVNDLILGIIGRAQSKYDVLIHAFVFMSNHFHLAMTVQSVLQMARFVGFVKGNIAKELGRLYGWREHFWSRRYHSASIGDSETAQFERFMYILANSCKEGLVASPLDWPGVSSARALFRGDRTLRGTWHDRTAEYRARNRGEHRLFPSDETVHLSPFPFLKERSFLEQREFVVAAVRQLEDQTAELHRQRGTAPIGAGIVRKQKPHDKPKEFKPSPAPISHAATREEFLTMQYARAAKVEAYRAAAERLKRGEAGVRFPPGCFPPPLPYVENRAPPS
jgi:REP element-mobilizing transposase RayT